MGRRLAQKYRLIHGEAGNSEILSQGGGEQEGNGSLGGHEQRRMGGEDS